MPTCTKCGQENPDGAKFCNGCGTVLAEPGRTGEERRIVSVLFVDLVGFTSRSEQLDPEDVRAFLVPYYERVRTELESFGGRVEKFVGDAVMGVFGAPVTFGDDAERAVRAAFAVRDWAEADGLQLRIAVNTGEAIVELDARPEQGEALIAGDVVNTAARLQTAAPVGAVIVGQETYTSTRGSIEYRPAQPVVAKGKEHPVAAWLALRATSAVGERPVGLIPMVGRDRELGVLTGIWDRVMEERRSHFVTVFGPSGIGKSRIALELSQLVADQGGRVIRGRSTPYGASSPYSAFAQQVKQVAMIFDSDDSADAQEKLGAAVVELAGPASAEEHTPNLAILLGLADEGDVRRPRDALLLRTRPRRVARDATGRRCSSTRTSTGPTRAFSTSSRRFAARVREVPVLFVALARPELLTDRPGWGGGLPAYTALPLDPLTGAASTQLAELLLVESNIVQGRAAAVAQTAEGNPLFIEELAASLAERSTGDVAGPADECPRHHRGTARLASRGRARRPRRRVGRRKGLLARRAARDLAPRRPVDSARLTRGARPDPARGGVADQGRPAVRLQARADPRRRLPDASPRAVVAPGTPPSRATSRQAPSVGQSHEALAHHWREAGENDRAVEHLTTAADQAGRGWAKLRAVTLYREALALMTEDDTRRRDVTSRLAVALQAAFHIQNLDVAPPEGVTPG